MLGTAQEQTIRVRRVEEEAKLAQDERKWAQAEKGRLAARLREIQD